MTITASYVSTVERGEISASVTPSSSNLPLAVLDSGRAERLPFDTLPTVVFAPSHAFERGVANAFAYVRYGHLSGIYSEFARVLEVVERATDMDRSTPIDDLITETIATHPTEAMHWTVRTYRLSTTPDSSLPILSVDGLGD